MLDTRASDKAFAGKVALVTGAASGIGFAIAKLFCQQGAAVAMLDVDSEKGAAALKCLQQGGGNAAFFVCDISDGEAMARAVSECVAHFGRLDYAANNAGFAGEMHPVAEMPEQEWCRVIDTMLTGVFLGMKYQLPHIVKAQGAIGNTPDGMQTT